MINERINHSLFFNNMIKELLLYYLLLFMPFGFECVQSDYKLLHYLFFINIYRTTEKKCSTYIRTVLPIIPYLYYQFICSHRSWILFIQFIPLR